MFYVNHRWLGGMLTNYQTISRSIDRLKEFEAMKEDGSIKRFPKKEILMMEKKAAKLERSLGGIKNMGRLPDIVYVVDPRKEDIAVAEGPQDEDSPAGHRGQQLRPHGDRPTPSRAMTTPSAPSACSPPGWPTRCWTARSWPKNAARPDR